MRILIISTILLAGGAAIAADDYRETRDLSLDADGLEALVIKAGSGNLDVRGVEGQDNIEVRATIVVPDEDEAGGRKAIEKYMTLALRQEGDTAKLDSRFDGQFWGFSSVGRIDLEITAPAVLAMVIDDGSGSIDVANFVADIRIDDGSGSIDVQSVAGLDIDDGSGSIEIHGATGDVFVNDGSGSITIERVSGSVTIDDGSGSILVRDVGQDLIIIDSGSGSVSYSDIKGTVEEDG